MLVLRFLESKDIEAAPRLFPNSRGLHDCLDMGGCRNYGPFLGTLNNRCRTIFLTLTLGNRDPTRDHNFENHPYVHLAMSNRSRWYLNSDRWLLVSQKTPC